MYHKGSQDPSTQNFILGVRGFHHLRNNNTAASVMSDRSREAKLAQICVSETREKRRQAQHVRKRGGDSDCGVNRKYVIRTRLGCGSDRAQEGGGQVSSALGPTGVSSPG